jgi:putative tricarboxylic transport membrane protein
MSWAAPAMESLHFLVPGGAGGGWDTTARATGMALMKAGLVQHASFENRSGAGGAKGFAYMLDRRARSESVLMVSSTPILVRTLRAEFQQNWRELTPVASMIGDYGALMVRSDAPWRSLHELVTTLRNTPESIKFAGGSNRGDLDHLILASSFQAFTIAPQRARYVPYGAGGQATLALLGGETAAMAATIGDAISYIQSGHIRALAVAAPQRLQALPDVPTFAELGYPLEFLNWRGFFAVPGLSATDLATYTQLLTALTKTQAWQDELHRHGWVQVFHPGEDFSAYLDDQEAQIAQFMRVLGFLQ